MNEHVKQALASMDRRELTDLAMDVAQARDEARALMAGGRRALIAAHCEAFPLAFADADDRYGEPVLSLVRDLISVKHGALVSLMI